MQAFQAIIIGSGQAGNPLAHNLADSGWKVALIEKEHMSGSCINYGCTPTKMMLASAQVAHMMADAPWTLFYKAMFIHPTMTEGFFTLMDNVK